MGGKGRVGEEERGTREIETECVSECERERESERE